MLVESIKLIFIALLIIIIPVYGQWNLYDIIDDTKFKRVKLSKFKNLFKAIDFQDISRQGILVSLFLFQLIAYFLSLFVLIIGFIFIINQKSPIIISLIILGVEVFAFLILIIILSIISKKRKNK